MKWDKFLRHRIDPAFYQTDIGMIMNLDTGKRLSPKAQKIIQDGMIKHEKANRAARISESKAEEMKLKAEGMQFWATPAAAEYLKVAIDSAYQRMTGRLVKMNRSTDAVAKLRKLYQENSPDM